MLSDHKHGRHAFYRQLSDKALYIAGHTRFGATVLCLETYLDVRAALKQVFTHNTFKEWLNRQAKHARMKAAYAERLLTSAELTVRCKVLVTLLHPVMEVLRLFDHGIPATGYVYFAMASMRERALELVNKYKLPQDVQDQVIKIIDDQWETLHADMHSAAYLLSPRYHHLLSELTEDNELMAGLKAVLKRLLPDTDTVVVAMLEFPTICVPGRKGFGDELFKKAAENAGIAPHIVWDTHGRDAPALRPVAMLVTSTWCQGSSCERNWKDHAVTHTKGRNRLGKRWAEKLVGIKANGRALGHAELLPESEYNWVGCAPSGDIAEEVDSDGDVVDETLVESGAVLFDDAADETMSWELGELDPSVLDVNAASCLGE